LYQSQQETHSNPSFHKALTKKSLPTGGRWHAAGVTDKGQKDISKSNVYLAAERNKSHQENFLVITNLIIPHQSAKP